MPMTKILLLIKLLNLERIHRMIKLTNVFSVAINTEFHCAPTSGGVGAVNGT